MSQKANIHTSQLRASPLAKNIIQFLLGQRSYLIVNIHKDLGEGQSHSQSVISVAHAGRWVRKKIQGANQIAQGSKDNGIISSGKLRLLQHKIQLQRFIHQIHADDLGIFEELGKKRLLAVILFVYLDRGFIHLVFKKIPT